MVEMVGLPEIARVASSSAVTSRITELMKLRIIKWSDLLSFVRQPRLCTTCSILSEETAVTETGLPEEHSWAPDRVPLPGGGHSVPGPGRGVRSRVPKSVAASALTSAGHRGLALTAGRGTPGLFGIQLRAGTPQPNRLTRSCGPADAGSQGELPSMDSCAAPSPSREAARGEGARGTRTKGCLSPDEVSGTSCSLRSGPKAPTAPTSSQDVFTSSFSFIRLSLGSAGERGEAEGCPPCREAEGPRQSPEEAEAKAASVDGPHEHPRLHSPTFTLKAPRGLADAAQTAEGSRGLQREMLPWLDRGAASACSPDPACSGGCRPGDPRRWDTLLSKLEPALLHCLQGQRRRLEVGVSPASGPVMVGAQIGSGQSVGNVGPGVDRLPAGTCRSCFGG
ncbi:hypothetical protein CB1_000692015 [Camelus ferus]|nr:hypothetical protein CB1_000692015 [Camelus ferus]